MKRGGSRKRGGSGPPLDTPMIIVTTNVRNMPRPTKGINQNTNKIRMIAEHRPI